MDESSTVASWDFMSLCVEIKMEINDTTPIPPIHEVAIRQNSRPLGTPSMSFKMDAPVVVKPETLSKRR